MRAELHCHSKYSRGTILPTEGIPEPREIVREAKRKGLDAVCITDHNVFRAFREGKSEARRLGILLVPGEEITSKEGHVLGIGTTELIPPGLELEETVERVREQGGVAVAPHPFDIKRDGVGGGFRKCDAVEVFSGLNLDRLSNILAGRKAGGMPRTVGSDAHTLGVIGRCVNVVKGDSLDSLLRGIRKGRVGHVKGYIRPSEVREWAWLRLFASRKEVEERVKTYSPLKRWVSLRLLERFMRGQGGFFSILSGVGLACSVAYGSAMFAGRIFD